MLLRDIERYLSFRRELGFSLRGDEYLLKSFARFAAHRGDSHVRRNTALDWAAQAPSPGQRDRRLRRVILFARHVRAEDPAHELPASCRFSLGRRPYLPHIFTPREVHDLLRAASRLGPRGSLRPHTYYTIFGLLAATGLRVSEALALRLDDVTDDGLMVRNTKFHKSRLVPLHPTAARAVGRYIHRRRRFACTDNHLFVSLRCRAVLYADVNRVFLQILRRLGLRGDPGRPGPRVHDLRHTMAVRALEAFRSTSGVGPHMRALSTYLGHSRVSTNFRYIHATPRLMGHIATACEAYLEDGAS